MPWSDPDVETWLLESLRRELRLDAFRGGLHDSRDERGLRMPGFRVERLWVAIIWPSFDPPGAIACLALDGGLRCGAALGTERHAPLGAVESVVAESFDLPSGWADPVTAALANLDVAEDDRTRSLDGIGYRLVVATSAVDATLRFHNPMTDGLKQLQRALHAAVSSAAEHSPNERLRTFAQTAARYAGS